MKNPHGVEPTRYRKKQESEYAIKCYPRYGPTFYNFISDSSDIRITETFNKKDSCIIVSNGYSRSEYIHRPKCSLFVDTTGRFNAICTILDYEVYCIDNYKDYINNFCKHPDIIWEFIETKDISEESLKEVDDDTELLNDLDAIYSDDNDIRVKISRCCLKNPSELLPNTQIVDQRCDSYLREWLGNDYNWKLIYRASEHEHLNYYFHEYCDNKTPTLVIIKSSGGWIFGGYTTQSWSGDGIYNDMIY